MEEDKIIHFVYFETLLGSEDFLVRWERYNSSANADAEVTLQESKKGDVFTYIAKHSSGSDEFQFAFTKGAKATRTKQEEIKKMQLGGYSVIQQENDGKTQANEYSMFVFLNTMPVNIDIYKQVQASTGLNIYKAYFENCSYTYILEYFIKNTNIDEFKENLKQFTAITPAVYTKVIM